MKSSCAFECSTLQQLGMRSGNNPKRFRYESTARKGAHESRIPVSERYLGSLSLRIVTRRWKDFLRAASHVTVHREKTMASAIASADVNSCFSSLG